MELGQKVKFKRYLRKNNYTNYCKGKQEKDEYLKYSIIELDGEKEGIICGKRVIGYRGYTNFEEYQTDYTSLETKTVILVANHMMGFYRIPAEWLEVIEDEENRN